MEDINNLPENLRHFLDIIHTLVFMPTVRPHKGLLLPTPASFRFGFYLYILARSCNPLIKFPAKNVTIQTSYVIQILHK